MRMRFSSTFAVALVLAGAAYARAQVVVETLNDLVNKSDLLVVCEVTKIEDVRTEKSERWNAMITTRRATLRVLRGITPADGASVTEEELTVEYPALKEGEAPANKPKFPVLAEGELSLFPLKRAEGGWRFVSEDAAALVMPAARRPIAARPETPRDYLLHELAGALVNGDYPTMWRAGKYLGDLGTEVSLPVQPTGAPARPMAPVADAVFALIRGEIGETGLRLDTRWVQIGTAAYMSADPTPPAIADLLADDAPVTAPLQLARLAFRKAGERDLDQRIMRLIVAHQEDPGAARRTATAITTNYALNPEMIGLERSAIMDDKPGAMAVADLLVKDLTSPFAERAAAAAREILDSKSKPYAQDVNPEAARHAVALLLRVGSDDDFAFFLDQIRRAKTGESPLYKQYLQAAGADESLSARRTLAIARLYIDDETPLAPLPEGKSWRVCDAAARMVGKVAGDDFGVKPAAMQELRDAGVARARKYLKSKE
jgi:hypothetical protein